MRPIRNRNDPSTFDVHGESPPIARQIIEDATAVSFRDRIEAFRSKVSGDDRLLATIDNKKALADSIVITGEEQGGFFVRFYHVVEENKVEATAVLAFAGLLAAATVTICNARERPKPVQNNIADGNSSPEA